MADDIIELKPGIGPLKVNPLALWRRFKAPGAGNPAERVAQRFLHLFEAHGVRVGQIPRFVPDVSHADLYETRALLWRLTPAVMERTADLFGVERSWLKGASDRMYPPLACYRQPEALFEVIRKARHEAHSFPVRVLTSAGALDHNETRRQPLAIVVAERVATAEGTDQIWDIERYHVFGDVWDWSEWECRIQLMKAMARAVDTVLDERVPLFAVDGRALAAVAEGRMVPRKFVARCPLTEPSLEDYSSSSTESAVARETDELPEVIEYIEANALAARAAAAGRELSRGH